jgi:hypothetical protein
MLRHVFLWNAKPVDPGDRILAAVNRVKDEPVPAASWSSGRDRPAPGSVDPSGRWQYGLVCDYESWEQLQACYSTPEHTAVVDEIVPLIADCAACDSELSAP